MEQSIFLQLSVVIVLAAIISLIMRALHQPLIMGYILTGILVGPIAFNLIHANEAFDTFAEIGITLLLFIIGLGLNIAIIKSLGKVAFVSACATLTLIGSLGFLASAGFGFTIAEAFIIGLALFFSSTIIILKVLSDKKETSRLYGQIAIGVILIEDIVATIALVLVAAAGKGGAGLSIEEVGLLVAKAAGIGIGLALVASKILPRLSKMFASSQELLFLFAIAWGFGIATLFDIIGLSHEVGALFAGVSLASLPYANEMSARLKPLRDFFIIIFFITLGEAFGFNQLTQVIVPAIALSLIVLVGKPFIIMASLGLLGYTKMTSFKAGIHLSQISEFSIILVIFAVSVELIRPEITALVTLVALITIGISTYLMKYDDWLFNLFQHKLRLFEGRVVHDEKKAVESFPLILFGYRKGGHEFVRTFRQLKKRYIVVDYDPEVIETLEHQGIRFAYGDATDIELLQEIGLTKAQMVVSVITDFTTNDELLRRLREHNQKAVFICHANNYEEAVDLYRLGATHVILPHYLGSERISNFIKRHGFDHQAFESHKHSRALSIGHKALKHH